MSRAKLLRVNRGLQFAKLVTECMRQFMGYSQIQ